MKIPRILDGLVLLFIIGLHLGVALMLSGCSMIDHPPARKAYVIVEKPPFRIMYVNDSEKINDQSVGQILRSAETYGYKNYKFNKEIMRADMDVSAEQTDHESDKDVRERTLKADVSTKIR